MGIDFLAGRRRQPKALTVRRARWQILKRRLARVQAISKNRRKTGRMVCTAGLKPALAYGTQLWGVTDHEVKQLVKVRWGAWQVGQQVPTS